MQEYLRKHFQKGMILKEKSIDDYLNELLYDKFLEIHSDCIGIDNIVIGLWYEARFASAI